MEKTWPNNHWYSTIQCLMSCKSKVTLALYMKSLRQLMQIITEKNDINNEKMITRAMLILGLIEYIQSIYTRPLLPSTVRCLCFRMLGACKTVWTDIYGIPVIKHSHLIQEAIRSNTPRAVEILVRLKSTLHNPVVTRNEVFTSDECRQLLQTASAKSICDHLMIELMLTTGIRIGSLQKMRWTHIDHQWRYMHVFEKGGKQRVIVLHPALVHILKKQKMAQIRDTIYLFPSNRKKHDVPLSTRWLRERFYAIGSKALPGVSIFPHMCRHTVVHRLFENKNSLTHISRFLGHASTTTTNQYYLKYSMEELVQQMNIPWLTFKTL